MAHVLGAVHRFRDAHMSGFIVPRPEFIESVGGEIEARGHNAEDFNFTVNFVGSPFDIQRLARFFGLDVADDTPDHDCDGGECNAPEIVLRDAYGSVVTVTPVERASDVLGTIRQVAFDSGNELPPWLA